MTKEAIAKARNNCCPIIMGHLEIAGFQTQKGRIMEKGTDPKTLDGFPLVLSGHYHHRNSLGAIHYLGTPYELTWADADDPKGFHVLDTDTLELTFIPNPEVMHCRLVYNGRSNINFSAVQGKIVKVIVEHRGDAAKFDHFLRQLEANNPESVTVMDENLVRCKLTIL
jgi:hypothetical protein